MLTPLPVIVPLKCEECGHTTLRIGAMNNAERGISKVPYFSYPGNCPQCRAMMVIDNSLLIRFFNKNI
jgi:predicted Zn-ribbon and HTH transcriptional regulator